jgi:hypothetical protein
MRAIKRGVLGMRAIKRGVLSARALKRPFRVRGHKSIENALIRGCDNKTMQHRCDIARAIKKMCFTLARD